MRRRTPVLLVVVPAVVVGVLTVPTMARAAVAPAVPATFSFSGAGWGHGVGLSQVGARGMAAGGSSAAQILTHYFRGTTVAPFRDDVDLRVNTQYLSPVVRLRVEPLASTPVAAVVAFGGRKVALKQSDVLQVSPSGTTTVLRRNGVIVGTGTSIVVNWSGTRDPRGTGSAPAVLNVVANGSFDGPGHRYRYGRFELRPRTTSSGSTTITAVNVLRLHDEYLDGLAEMPSSWPAAALQAQVIAARGYALVKYRAGVRSGCWCHVFDDTSDQVFAGYVKQSSAMGARWTAAVRATNTSSTTSSIVLFKGAPAQTFFFSSSGGRTQNSEDVWTSAVPYLRSVDDHWSRNPAFNPSYSAWGPRIRTQAQVAAAFGLRNVVRIDLSDRNSGGAVRMAKAWSSAGVVGLLAGSSLSRDLGMTSRWFWMSGSPPTPPPPPPPTAFTVVPSSRGLQSTAGNGVLVTGLVRPASRAAGSSVSLQMWDVRRKAWLYAAGARVDARGRYSFSRVAKLPMIVNYRVYKPASVCSPGCTLRTGLSPVVTVAFADRWSVSARTTTPVTRFGSSATVAGTVTPAPVARNTTVTVIRRDVAARRWVAAGSGRVDAKGRFTVAARATAVGAQQYSVVVPRARCSGTVCLYLSAWSSRVNVRVTQPFVVSVKGAPGDRQVVLTGSVSPSKVAAGQPVRVFVRRAGAWVYVATAVVGRDGRFTRTVRGLHGPVLSLRISKAASGCDAGGCTYLGGFKVIVVRWP